MKPYKVCPWVGDRAADIADRTTGARVGFVLADFYGRWHTRAFDVTGRPRTVGVGRRYRSDAAAAVWAAHTKGTP